MQILSQTLLASAVALASTQLLAQDYSAPEIESVLVIGYSEETLQAKVNTVSGGANLITPQTEMRLSNLKDALDFQPGIIVQEFFGGIDQPRLNIRGSGIQSNPVNRGVLLLQDGLPLNEADGSFVIGTLQMRDLQGIVVKRGANAREPGATTLGGSLNFIPEYGNNQPNKVRVEGGSFGRYGVQGSFNAATQKGDFHLSASSDSYDGYRHLSGGERQSLHSNMGVRFSDTVSSRFYFNYANLAFDIPFVVPKARVTTNPKGVMGDGNTPFDNILNAYKRKPHRDTQQYRLANLTEWAISEHSRHTLGAYWQQTQDSFVDPLSHADTDSDTYGLQWSYDTSLNRTDITVAAGWDSSDMQRIYSANNPANGSKLQTVADLDMTASNTHFSVQINHAITDRIALDGQVRWNKNCRDVSDRLNQHHKDQCWNSTDLAAGINWQTGQQRWFANISSSSEAPTFWEINSISIAPPNPAIAQARINTLETQQALTLELGGQGMWIKNHFWNLSLYRSQVEDELLSVANEAGGNGYTHNYSDDTLHQGIELGLFNDGDLHYRLAWNYSDFTFDGGLYDGKTLAGIPEHIISAELGYRIAQWDISTNLRWLPEDTAVDHVNSLYQDSYHLLGLQLSFHSEQGWRAFARVDNISDEKYASAFVIRNRSALHMPTFLPGTGRSISAGIQMTF